MKNIIKSNSRKSVMQQKFKRNHLKYKKVNFKILVDIILSVSISKKKSQLLTIHNIYLNNGVKKKHIVPQ